MLSAFNCFISSCRFLITFFISVVLSFRTQGSPSLPCVRNSFRCLMHSLLLFSISSLIRTTSSLRNIDCSLSYNFVFTFSSSLYLGPAIAITCLFFSICSFISNAFSDKCIGIVLFLNGTSWHFSTFLIYFTGSASSLSLFSCRITIPITQPKIVTGEPDNPW